MKDLANKLDMPLSNTTISRSERHVEACDAGTFVWNMGRDAQRYADELDALFREILVQQQTELQIANT